jgi:hypothetical protein
MSRRGSARTTPRGRVGAASDFRPTQLAGCVLWLRGDLGITTDSNGNVSAWTDQSGNSHSLSQGATGLRPSYNTADAGYNSQPTLGFNGSVCLPSAAAWTLNQPDTWYIVGEANTQMSVNGEFIDSNQGDGNRHVVGRTSGSTGTFYMYAGAGSGYPVGTSVTGSKVTLCGVFNGSSSAIYTNRYGTADGTGNPGANPMTQLYLGGITGGFLLGKIAEVIAYNSAHGIAARQQLLQYLGARYGIAVS